MADTAAASIYKIEPLRGAENYSVWKVRMQHILTDLGYDDHIKDSAAVPADPALVAAWNTKDRKALSTIVLRVSDNVLVYVANATHAKIAWASLSSMYEAKGAIGITLTRRKFHRAICAEDADIEEHIRIMRSMQVELSRLGHTVQDEEFAYTLLESLPESWDTFVSAIGEDIAKDSAKLIARILSEDSRRKSRNTTATADVATALAVTSSTKCFECGGAGHFASDHRNGSIKPRNDQQRQDSTRTFNSGTSSSRGQRHRFTPRKGKPRAHIAIGEVNELEDVGFLTRNPNLTSSLSQNDWLLDSACSTSIVRNRAAFTAYTATPGQTIQGLGEAPIPGRGNVPLSFALGQKSKTCIMRNVLHCPTAPCNLVSVSRLTDAGYQAIFKNNIVEIRSKTGSLLAIGDKITRVYKLRLVTEHALLARSWDDWHRALGHLHHGAVKKLKTKNMVLGMDVDTSKPPHQCTACIQGKAHIQPYPKGSDREYKDIGDMTYSDLWGKASRRGIGGEWYFISFTDAKSARSRVKFLKDKTGSSVLKAIQNYCAFMKTQTGRKPRCFRFDNGKEYVNQEVLDWLESQGIEYELTAPYSSAQNGVSERLNRTTVERARAMLVDSNLPWSLWPEAVNYAFYLKNMSPTNALSDDITPHEAFWHHKPDISNIRQFGAIIWVLQQSTKVHKLMPKAKPFRFVGLSEHARAFRYYNPTTRGVQHSRNVTFQEPTDDYPVPTPLPPLAEGEKAPQHQQPDATAPSSKTQPDTASHDLSSATPNSDDDSDMSSLTSLSSRSPSPVLRPPRPPRPPKLPKPLAPRDIDGNISEANIIDGPRRRTQHTALFFRDFAFASIDATSLDDDPKSVDEARTRSDWPQWQEAMQKELDQHERMRTWTLMELSTGRKPVACKWVYRLKRNETGQIVKYKARLVAKGYSQIPGIDFMETYAPTIRLETFRFLIALAARHNLKIHGMDVVAAYLNGKLNEDVYMDQPPGFNDGTGRVGHLRLSLYGLRQSGHNWNKTLDAAFKKLGFARLLADQCVYIRRQSPTSLPVIVAVHVDDMTLLAHTITELTQLKGELASQFTVTDLGELSHILGMEIKHDADHSIWLSQTIYAQRVLDSVGMQNSKPVATPLDSNVKLAPLEDGDSRIGNDSLRQGYLSGLGKLMYLAVGTRPDLAYAVQHLSQFSQRPGNEHMSALKRVFRYLQSTLKLGLHFCPTGDLATYSDADWGNSAIDRRSISGYISLYASSPVTWSSRKQPTVALSTMEAEFMALARTTCEVLWLRQLSQELGIQNHTPTRIQADNQSAICFAENANFHARSKHIDIRYHFVRERVASHEVELSHCASEDNLADILTKALPRQQFEALRSRLLSHP